MPVSGLYHEPVVITGWLLNGGVIVKRRCVFMREGDEELASQDLET